MSPLRVLIVDDHAAVRAGLRRIVDNEVDMEVVGEAADGPEGLHAARTLRPSVVLMDVSMPGWNGVEATRQIVAACPGQKVIAVSRHDDPSMVRAMLNAGAAGYVLKGSASTELTQAIRAVASGYTYVDTAVQGTASPAGSEVARGEHVGGPSVALTDREEDVLRLVAQARTNAEISQGLSMPAADVAATKDRAMRKARLASRVQVIAYARGRGWIDEP